MVRQNRRRFLAAAGVGITAGVAGCVTDLRELAGVDPGGANGGDTPTDGTEADGGTPTEQAPAGEVLVDFDDGVDDWYDLDSYGSFEATTDVRNGEGGIRLMAGEQEPYVGAVYSLPEQLDFRGKNLSISLNATSPQIHRVEVQLVAPDQGNLVRLNRTNTGPTGHWLNVDMGVTHERGDPDQSQVYGIRLIGRDRGQQLPIDLTVDEIRLHDAPDSGRVVMTWDDCHQSHWRAFEMMEEYDFPGVDGVIHHAVGAGDRLNVSELQEMQSAGWDIVSHPHHNERGSTPFTEENFSEEEMRGMIENSIQWLEARGFEEGARHFVAPGQLRDATAMALLREYHDSALSFGGGNTGLPLSDTHAIGRYQGREMEPIRKHVGFAEEYNQASVILWQNIGDDPEQYDITVDQFREVLDLVDGSDLEVVTVSDLVSNAV